RDDVANHRGGDRIRDHRLEPVADLDAKLPLLQKREQDDAVVDALAADLPALGEPDRDVLEALAFERGKDRDDHLRARRALALRQLLLEPRAIGGRQDAGVIVDPCGGRRRQREYQDQRDAEQQPRTSLWAPRSEERRVGKECRSRWAREQTK